jgi:hypothetical protein
MICRRVYAAPGSDASSPRILNSDGVRETAFPSTVTSSRIRSIVIAPTVRTRLGDVVVGAEVETDEQVSLGVLGGEHDDRHVALGADLPAGVLARELGQHQVEDHEVDRVRERGFDGRLAVRRHLHLELLTLERVGEAADERGLVVDDEDAGAHRFTPSVAVASVMRTVVPTHSSESSSISPPSVRTASRAIERPRPNPPSRWPLR